MNGSSPRMTKPKARRLFLGVASDRGLAKRRLHRSTPWTFETLDPMLRRRSPVGHDRVERVEIAGFVEATQIQARTALQARTRERQRISRHLAQVASADSRREREPGRVVARFLTILRAPALYQFERARKRVGIVVDAHH